MNIKFLLPGTTSTWHSGGLIVALKLARFLSDLRPLEIVTYEDREPDHPFLTENYLADAPADTLWLITFGPHVSRLFERLNGRRVVYYAQSAGWSIDMPAGATILCVSRFVMAYWAKWAPGARLFLVPPTLDPACRNHQRQRDIDVLYLSRKTTPYLHDELVPQLRESCRVETVDEMLPHRDVLDLFNRAKVYIYDYVPSSDRALGDGFGLQPLEAIVCGCAVFTTVNGGPCDYLDPGINCSQISGDAERDLAAILSSVSTHSGGNRGEAVLQEQYSVAALRERLRSLVDELETVDVRVDTSVRLAPPLPPNAPHTQGWVELAVRHQQEIDVLKDQVRYHQNAVTIHREGIDWLRDEVAQRERTITAREEGIAWLREEIARRDRAIVGLDEHDESRAHRLYERALARYRRERTGLLHNVYRAGFERAIAVAAIALARAQRIRFPSRAIGGWWSIERWRFEFLMQWAEYSSVQACRRLIRPGMTVIDIGAHLGYYTRIFSELVGSTGRVLAFEAEPENFEILRAHVSGAKYRNVETFPYAVADRAGKLLLHLSPGHSNHSLVDGYTESKSANEVETVPLDAFLAGRSIDRIDFVKIDVEGAEPLVLAGMRETIARSPHLAMLVELNPIALRAGGNEPDAFTHSLEAAGFRLLADLNDGRWGPPPPQPNDETFNLLCLRAT
ncbi:MAG TPA: FkbM family methyltransferase [Thermoanaerobaculia bacterium]|jgi:FkbM family methyltransferase|nr:FkbM family methyltransferase [Thermoanaerobaculia bacterium]